jgi:eukaryotic-like serine/threonine-protein kinase
LDDLTGKSLRRYHIIGHLGEGEMADVYKAYDTQLERDVAIKVIWKDAFPLATQERMLKRFEREAKSQAKMSHPNIVKVFNFGM